MLVRAHDDDIGAWGGYTSCIYGAAGHRFVFYDRHKSRNERFTSNIFRLMLIARSCRVRRARRARRPRGDAGRPDSTFYYLFLLFVCFPNMSLWKLDTTYDD